MQSSKAAKKYGKTAKTRERRQIVERNRGASSPPPTPSLQKDSLKFRFVANVCLLIFEKKSRVFRRNSFALLLLSTVDNDVVPVVKQLFCVIIIFKGLRERTLLNYCYKEEPIR